VLPFPQERSSACACVSVSGSVSSFELGSVELCSGIVPASKGGQIGPGEYKCAHKATRRRRFFSPEVDLRRKAHFIVYRCSSYFLILDSGTWGSLI
jgi:hypothetical protein